MKNDTKAHGSKASQQEWQSRMAALRQGSMLPCFPASESAFDAVAENRFTYGKAGKVKWSWQPTKGEGANPVTLPVERLDKSQDSKWVRQYVAPQHRVTVDRVGVTQEQCDRVTWLHESSDSTSDIVITSYGKVVIFRKTATMRRFIDTRSPEHTLPLSFAKSELRRLLGVTEGERAFALLTCNPATLQLESPVKRTQGSALAG